MRALVTYSSGFIGAALTGKLLSLRWEVAGIDCHSDHYSIDMKEERLKDLFNNHNFHFNKADISSRDNLGYLVKDLSPYSIFHLASQAEVGLSSAHIHCYVESNLNGFYSVLQLAVVNNLPNFLIAYSYSVYGDRVKIPYHAGEKNLQPNSFCGATKLLNEILAKSLISNSNTRAWGLRLRKIYAPMGRPDRAYFRIISGLIAGMKFDLFGDGSVRREFTYVDDCIKIIQLLDNELSSRPAGYIDVVSIGGGHPKSMSEPIRLRVSQLGVGLEPNRLQADSKDLEITMANPDLRVKLGGLKISTPLEFGLSHTIHWATKSAKPDQLRAWVEYST